MGTVSYNIETSGRMITGEKYARGTIKMGATYATSGDALNLANVFKSDKSCVVMVGGGGGYAIESTVGRNADNQLIVARDVGWYHINANSGAANQALTQIGNGSAVLAAVNVPFTAYGQPY